MLCNILDGFLFEYVISLNREKFFDMNIDDCDDFLSKESRKSMNQQFQIIFLLMVIFLLGGYLGAAIYKTKCQERQIFQLTKAINPINPVEHIKKITKKSIPLPFTELEVVATGYANVKKCCYPYFDGVTSTGRDANLSGVAVDPSIIPYGSHIEIEGVGVFLADDCGSAIKGARIDIRFKTYKEAIQWGRKKIKIKIYSKVEK